MFRKSNGFTLLETLVALNIWLFLIISFLPQFMLIEKERHDLILMGTANEVLQEELAHYLYDGISNISQDVVRGNKQYNVSSEVVDNNMTKICVTWKDTVGKNKLKCGYGKQ